MRGRGYRFRLALTLFAGCLTWPLAALAFTSAAQPAVAAGQACLNTVYRSPDYAALLPHIPADIGAVTARQLADPAFVTPQEIAAIGATHPRLQQCREALLGALTRAEPLLVPILNTAFAKSDGDLAALVERKIAWGEYARRLRGRAAQTRSLIEEAERIAASDTKKPTPAQALRVPKALASCRRSETRTVPTQATAGNMAGWPIATPAEATAQAAASVYGSSGDTASPYLLQPLARTLH
jgi:hypothetical protein